MFVFRRGAVLRESLWLLTDLPRAHDTVRQLRVHPYRAFLSFPHGVFADFGSRLLNLGHHPKKWEVAHCFTG